MKQVVMMIAVLVLTACGKTGDTPRDARADPDTQSASVGDCPAAQPTSQAACSLPRQVVCGYEFGAPGCSMPGIECYCDATGWTCYSTEYCMRVADQGTGD